MAGPSNDNNLKSQISNLKEFFIYISRYFLQSFQIFNLADLKDQGMKNLISIYQRKRMAGPSNDNNLKSQISVYQRKRMAGPSNDNNLKSQISRNFSLISPATFYNLSKYLIWQI